MEVVGERETVPVTDPEDAAPELNPEREEDEEDEEEEEDEGEEEEEDDRMSELSRSEAPHLYTWPLPGDARFVGVPSLPTVSKKLSSRTNFDGEVYVCDGYLYTRRNALDTQWNCIDLSKCHSKVKLRELVARFRQQGRVDQLRELQASWSHTKTARQVRLRLPSSSSTIVGTRSLPASPTTSGKRKNTPQPDAAEPTGHKRPRSDPPLDLKALQKSINVLQNLVEQINELSAQLATKDATISDLQKKLVKLSGLAVREQTLQAELATVQARVRSLSEQIESNEATSKKKVEDTVANYEARIQKYTTDIQSEQKQRSISEEKVKKAEEMASTLRVDLEKMHSLLPGMIEAGIKLWLRKRSEYVVCEPSGSYIIDRFTHRSFSVQGYR